MYSLYLFIALALSSHPSFTILYNNVPYDERLETSWGFSCLVEEEGKRILFDTGGDGDILLSNMKTLKMNPRDVNAVVISHIHADHLGGLWRFLEVNNEVKVYLPSSFPERIKKKVEKMGAKEVDVKGPMKICTNVYTTGELGERMKEQSLIVKTDKGIVLVTGCAHPGIVNIAGFAKQFLQDKLYLAVGGFHLIGMDEKDVERIIKGLKSLGVEKTAPSHCTGGHPIEMFRKAWGKDFYDMGCGKKLVLE
jgi:7,8-dihydropterin-6-yl-methyl-4-(beta-D-ribofuranosyl)aminobenzene 5'-phosphate synthase